MAKQHTPPVQESHKLTNIATIDHFIEQSLSCCDHVIITMKKHDAKHGKTTFHLKSDSSFQSVLSNHNQRKSKHKKPLVELTKHAVFEIFPAFAAATSKLATPEI